MTQELDCSIESLQQARAALQLPTTAGPSIARNPEETSRAALVMNEHRQQFFHQALHSPYKRIPSRPRQARGRTVSRKFFCLADHLSSTVPSVEEKRMLQKNELGWQSITFPLSLEKKDVKEILFKAFPKLKDCGGIELLTASAQHKQKLTVVKHGSCSAEELRFFGTGLIYIRPLQASIELQDETHEEYDIENCLYCGMEMSAKNVKEHVINYCIALQSEEFGAQQNPEARYSTNKVSENVGECSSEESSSNSQPQCGKEQDNTVDITEYRNYTSHRERALKETVNEMIQCHDPISILTKYQKLFMRGRKLDVEDDTSMFEGDTYDMIIRRDPEYFFTDAMEEIMREDWPDLSVPLEVNFVGEEAVDLGGPRKEFLGMVLRNVKEILFLEKHGEYALTHNINHEKRGYYRAAGIYMALSILQGGPLPAFLPQNVMDTLKLKQVDNLKEPLRQLREGLAYLGILQLLHEKNSIQHLFLKTSQREISCRQLVATLKADFSTSGSNVRVKEEAMYKSFVQYLRECSSGRRCVSVADVFKFVTGLTVMPILGFSIPPRIKFKELETAEYAIPTSRTCINQLELPLCHLKNEEMFQRFDLAFANSYFGIK